MKPLRTVFSVVFLAAALGGIAIASTTTTTEPATPNDAPMWHGGHWGPGHPGAGFRRVLGQLDLTAEQKTQVRSIFEQAKPQLQAALEGARANREKLAVTPPTDPAYPSLLATAKSGAVAQIQLMSDLWTQVYATLTADQRARIPGIVASLQTQLDARRASWEQQRKAQ